MSPGCGKSNVARFPVRSPWLDLEEGDSLNRHSSRDKMAARLPLNDEVREPWLVKVADT